MAEIELLYPDVISITKRKLNTNTTINNLYSYASPPPMWGIFLVIPHMGDARDGLGGRW